jgi:hypothetical protein
VQREAGPIDAGTLVEVLVHVDLDEMEAATSVHNSSCRFIKNFRSSPGTRIEQWL